MRAARRHAICLTALAASALLAAHAGGIALTRQDFMIPALDAGIELHLRNERPARTTTFPVDRVVLFVHGATFPATVAFDFDMPGGAWMKLMAGRGFDVFGLDIRGYGGSTRPAAMAQEPAANPPFADTRAATRDIAAAVDFILRRRGIHELTLIGWSWGTTTTAAFAAEHPDKVGRLVLVSPVWLPMIAPIRARFRWRPGHGQWPNRFGTIGEQKKNIRKWPVLASGRFWNVDWPISGQYCRRSGAVGVGLRDARLEGIVP